MKQQSLPLLKKNRPVPAKAGIKAWKRQWKLRLIGENNPEWNDLYGIICEKTGFLPPQE
jgi:predicted GIY-YIG superfamily endonuclease